MNSLFFLSHVISIIFIKVKKYTISSFDIIFYIANIDQLQYSFKAMLDFIMNMYMF